MNNVKTCAICKTQKTIYWFSKDIGAKDGLFLYCKPCANAKRTAHRLINPFHNTWNSMINRCYNHKATSYVNYGGRGVTVCDEWRDLKTGYAAFVEHVSVLPNAKSPGYTMNRKNNDYGYTPGNVEWATWIQQNQNRRKHKNALKIQSNHFGVSWITNSSKWQAKVTRNCKTKYLGNFDNQDDAAMAVSVYLKSIGE